MSKKTLIPAPKRKPMVIDGVVIDDNWISPGTLAKELKVTIGAVSNWIIRDQIKYVEIPGATNRHYLVDRRTVPNTSPNNAGRPRK